MPQVADSHRESASQARVRFVSDALSDHRRSIPADAPCSTEDDRVGLTEAGWKYGWSDGAYRALTGLETETHSWKLLEIEDEAGKQDLRDRFCVYTPPLTELPPVSGTARPEDLTIQGKKCRKQTTHRSSLALEEPSTYRWPITFIRFSKLGKKTVSASECTSPRACTGLFPSYAVLC